MSNVSNPTVALNPEQPRVPPKRRLHLTAAVVTADGERLFSVTGQEARTLQALVSARVKGITALEVSTWALRLAAYCFNLIHHHGLTIVTLRESHPGGWHGRHILQDTVRIVSISGGSEE